MARLKRVGPVGIPQHIIQRGNNRQVCFAAEQDMAVYANLLHEYSKKFSVFIHAWVFMTIMYTFWQRLIRQKGCRK